MSDSIDTARETIERSGEEAGGLSSRKVAVLVAILAAALALAEMGEKGAQNAYLTHHITASDDWAFYQAKTIRSNIYTAEASLLAAQPNAADPAIVARIAAAKATAQRMEDDEKTVGRKQLQAKAQESEHERDHQFHRYHLFELVVSALQIAIVLASVAVVTQVRPLAIGAGVVGICAAVFGLAITFGII